MALATAAGGSYGSYPSFSLGNTASQPLLSPSLTGSYLFPARPAPLPAASATRSHPQPFEAPPLNRQAGHWHSPGPIATSPLRSRHQSLTSGGGVYPKSLRLLPGPLDPFCLGRAKLGSRARHFREEAFRPRSSQNLGVGSRLSRPAFATFHVL